MFNKKFLKESPVIWCLAGMVIALILLVVALLKTDWYEATILAVLLAWMFTCAKKDYIIWKLTKGGTQ